MQLSIVSDHDGGPSQKFLINQVHNKLQVEVQEQVYILLANGHGLEAVQGARFCALHLLGQRQAYV